MSQNSFYDYKSLGSEKDPKSERRRKSDRRREERRTRNRRITDGPSLQKIKKYTRVFTQSTGVNSLAVTYTITGGQILYSYNETCQLCKFFDPFLDEPKDCHGALIEGCQQAEHHGGRFVFFCPYGLAFFSSPIVYHNMQKGALLGGPVLMSKPEDFLDHDLLAKHDTIKKINIKEQKPILQYLKKLPASDYSKVGDMSELLFIIASDFNKTIQEVSQDYKTALEDGNIPIYIDELRNYITGKSDPEILKNEKDLEKLIDTKDQTTLADSLNKIMETIISQKEEDLNNLLAQTLDFSLLLYNLSLYKDIDFEQVFGIDNSDLIELKIIDSHKQLSFWLKRLVDNFNKNIFTETNEKHDEIIAKAVAYIKHNYMNKISLYDVSDHVYLSPSYFSKIFGEKMNCKFNNYLNNVRIANAQKLLREGEVRLSDITHLVGFEDQSYFSKVFKRMTGYTPKHFRNRFLSLKEIQ